MNSAHWDEYWRSSAKSTLSEYDKKAYGEELSDIWHKIIEEKTEQGAVVDLACGNGDLALLAFFAFKKKRKQAEIYAVDYADILLDEKVQSEGALNYINWLPNTLADQLPIESNSISLVISQFGFEYTDRVKTVNELARVVKGGGHVSFLMHHPSSFISLQSKSEIACYEAILIDENLFESAKTLLLAAKNEKGSQNAEQLRFDFNKRLSRIFDRFGEHEPVSIFISSLKKSLSRISIASNEELTSELEELQYSYNAHYKRLKHMIDSTLSEKDVLELIEKFIEYRFKTVELITYKNAVGILGWWLTMKKL